MLEGGCEGVIKDVVEGCAAGALPIVGEAGLGGVVGVATLGGLGWKVGTWGDTGGEGAGFGAGIEGLGGIVLVTT